MIIVLTTVPNEKEAALLARKIIDERLAACVQILPQMTSVYFWENEIQEEPEHLMLIKTLAEKYGGLEEFIRANHSYSTPEIIAIEAKSVSPDYAAWLGEYLG